MKKPYNIDVAVLCLFFNRSEPFKQVFDQVKKARPSKLFLYQDGPRNDKDMPGILECRKISSEIDWECEVHTLYQEKNFGCDPSEFISQKWAFSFVDKCIVLEDDDVPSLTFFSFCKAMLDKYENDNRVMLISGINYEGQSKECPYDYFFTSDVAIWGWASWRRVIDQWEEFYDFLDKPYEVKQIKNYLKYHHLRKELFDLTLWHKSQNKAYYETILIMNQILNNGLSIVPTKNLINNIGFMADSTHFSSSLKSLPSCYKKITMMDRFEFSVDSLKCPPYVIEDFDYNERINKFLVRNSKVKDILSSLSVLFKRLYNGDFSAIIKSITRRL